MALIDNIVGYWKLNESLGNTRLDETANANDLEDVNTVAQRSGKIETAADFTRSNVEYLKAPSGGANFDAVSFGDEDFTVSAWVNLSNVNLWSMTFAAKWYAASGNKEWILFYNVSSKKFQFNISDDGQSASAVTANNFGTPSANTWYHLLAWHDSTSDTINIAVNNGTPDSASHTTGASNVNEADMTVGSHQNASDDFSPFATDGGIDEVAIWNRLLTDEEKADLYNSGNGNQYDFVIREVISEIKPSGGGDYTNLADWESDRRGNIAGRNDIEIARCFKGDSGLVNIEDTNWDTDAERFIKIESADIDRHSGIFENNLDNIAHIDSEGSLTSSIVNKVPYTQVSGMVLTGVGSNHHVELTTGDKIDINACIFNGRETGISATGVSGVIIKNSIMQDLDRGVRSNNSSANVEVYNNTIVADVECLEVLNDGHITEENNYLHAGGNPVYDDANGTISSGVTTATSTNEALTPSLRNIAFDDSTFVDPNGSPRDLHIVDGSPLKNQGTDLSASGVFIDIDGVLRTGSEPYDIGSDEITQLTLTTVPTVSLGGFMQSTADGPVSGFIGGYLGARGIIVPQADVGGFLKGKALPGFNRIALMGGYLEGTGGVKGPDSIGGYLFAIPLTTVPNKIVGGYASGAFEQSANLGGFTFGRPKFKTFAELHARTLVKVRSEDVVDQGLNLDAKTIFKQVDNQEFNAKFIWFAESAADFNAKLKVEKYKEVPNVQILSVTPASGGLKEDGCQEVTVTASGELGDGVEWINTQIDFGEPLDSEGVSAPGSFQNFKPPKAIFSHNLSISGFSGPPPWISNHVYCASGKYIITVRGQDNLGMIGSDAYRLNLASGLDDDKDFPKIKISATPRSGFVPDSLFVQFGLESSGIPDSPITSTNDTIRTNLGGRSDERILWSMGNREISNKINPNTYYQSPGLYAPVLRYRYFHPNGSIMWVSDSLYIGFNR